MKSGTYSILELLVCLHDTSISLLQNVIAEWDLMPLNLQTELTLGFMDHLMLGTPSSPLRKLLLEI